MIQAYLDHGETKTAVFEFFVRKLPRRRGFLMAAGLEQALDFLERLHFTKEEIDWLANTGRFSDKLLAHLSALRFTGDVHAMPEGEIFFANEPILRVTAPLDQAQLVETRLINILHFQSLIAAKAARFVLSAPGKMLVDFGLRRAHGAEAGLWAARASYIAGFAGTATMLAEMTFGIPTYGTMAHSFIQTFDNETAAFESFAQSRPDNLTLLIDTYDTVTGAKKVVTLAPKLKARGITIRAVRLDSGDLASLSKIVRRILDEGGLGDILIFASGGLDEDQIQKMLQSGAPIDGFGLGTNLTTSSDVPALDCAYKLQEYAGTARRKTSEGKATWPGRKQVWRSFTADGVMSGDTLTLLDDPQPASQSARALLAPVMRGGRRVPGLPTLDEARRHAASQLKRLPEGLRRLEPASYPVEIAPALRRLAEDCDRRTRAAS